MSAADIKQQAARLQRAAKKPPLVVSAVSGQGVKEVLRAVLKVIQDTWAGAAGDSPARSAWHA